MRQLILIPVLLFQLIACAQVKELNGKYVNGNSIEFKFDSLTKTFKYKVMGEMGILAYSSGNWVIKNNKVELSGFTDSNLKQLDVTTGKGNGISIHYVTDSFESYIKTVAVINDSLTLTISKDTTFIPSFKSRTIQVKSYLYTPGFLLSGSHTIDTLYSPRINTPDNSATLNIVVHSEDFARIKLATTLAIKGRKTLLYNNKIKLIKK